MSRMKAKMAANRLEHRKSGLSIKKDFKKNWSLYLFVLPVLVFYGVFCYGPMYGIVIAFKEYSIGKGIGGSPWIGLENIANFFKYPEVGRLFVNVLRINVISLLFWPSSIIFALIINELRWTKYKKVTQTISIFPHFVSGVVTCTVVRQFCQVGGIFSDIVAAITGNGVNLLTVPAAFPWILQIKDVWQGVGWGSVMYLAAMSGVDKEIYEAAELDGASRIQRMRHITIPGISPTIIILFIMKIGGMMSVGSDTILLLYNPSIYSTADVISTYVYRQGLEKMQFSYSAAIDLFNSIIGIALTFMANQVAKTTSDTSLF